MQPVTASPHLTPHELANIAQALEVHASEFGTKILGAQLGLLIANAIRPKTLRELGGMRKLAVEVLTDYVQAQAPTVGASDLVFEIQNRPQQISSLSHVPTQPTEVAGADLWRFFANPKLPCKLAATRIGAVYVSSLEAALPNDARLLQRPVSDEYKTLARQFAEQQEEPVRSNLQTVLEPDDFYNDWIASLRRLRTSGIDLLRQWETLRAEHVAKRLHESLAAVGIEDAGVAEIVALARPSVFRRAMFASVQPSAGNTLPLPLSPSDTNTSRSSKEDIASLRYLLHQAIDQMSVAELREIRIPAGLLHDAARSYQR